MSAAEQYLARESDLQGAGQFAALCRGILRHQAHGEVNWTAVERQLQEQGHALSARNFATKAAAIGTGAWGEAEGRVMSNAYLKQVAPANLVDAVKPFALTMPEHARIFIATGVIAEGSAEGAAKPTTPLELTTGDPVRPKVASILVFSREVAHAQGEDADRLFRRLLRDAVIEASNGAFLNALPLINVPAGANALESLNAGIAAADTSEAYVVAAAPEIVRELALQSDGRMPVGGGEFTPGVIVLPVAVTSASPAMVVVAASNVAMRDHGLQVRQAEHATVDLADPAGPPTAPTTPISLFQENCSALLVERQIEVLGGSPAVAVG